MSLPLNKKLQKMKTLTGNIKNPGGGLGVQSDRTEDCDFTYDGFQFQNGPYYDCRDSCANHPNGNGHPGCDPNLDPCDYYIFVSDIYNTREATSLQQPYGQFTVALSFIPTTTDRPIGPVNSFQLAMDFCSDRPIWTSNNVDNGGVIGHVENHMYPMLMNEDCNSAGESALGLECDDFPGHMAVQTMRATSTWLASGEHEFYLKHQNIDAYSASEGQRINYLLNQDCSCVNSVISGISTNDDALSWAPYDISSYPVDVYNLVNLTLSHANAPDGRAYDTSFTPSGDNPDWMGPDHNIYPNSGECNNYDIDGGGIDCMNPECFVLDENLCNLDDSCFYSDGYCNSVGQDICGPWTCGGDYGHEFAIGSFTYEQMCCYDNYSFQDGEGCLPYGYGGNMTSVCAAGGDHEEGILPNVCNGNRCTNTTGTLDWSCGSIIESSNEQFCRDKYLGEYVGDIIEGYINPVTNWHTNAVAAYHNCMASNHECYSSEWEQECTWCDYFYHCAQGEANCQSGSAGYPGTTNEGAIWRPGSEWEYPLPNNSKILKIDIARNFYCHPDNWDAGEDAATQGCVSRLHHILNNESVPANFAFLPAFINLDALEEVSAGYGENGVPAGSNDRDLIIHNFYLDNLFGCNDSDACHSIFPGNMSMAYNPFSIEDPDGVCQYNNGIDYRLDEDEDGYGTGDVVNVCDSNTDFDGTTHCTDNPDEMFASEDVVFSTSCDLETDDVNPSDPCSYNHYDGCGYCNYYTTNVFDICTQAPDGTYNTWNSTRCTEMECDGSCVNEGSSTSENGGWDDCGDCNGNNEALNGCGCDEAAPVEYYLDTDDDLLIDPEFTSCGVLCEGDTYCDGTVDNCYDTLDSMNQATGMNCAPWSAADPYPQCDGCTDLCGQCFNNCEGDANGNCTSSCAGSSHTEYIPWCGTIESETCCDCKGVPYGTHDYDCCNVCDGDGTSCCNNNGVCTDTVPVMCNCYEDGGEYGVGFCPDGLAGSPGVCGTSKTTDDVECDPAGSYGYCGITKSYRDCEGNDNSVQCCPQHATCDCNNTCGGNDFIDCCGDCVSEADDGMGCEDACGRNCSPSADGGAQCDEHNANNNAYAGYNSCWGNDGSGGYGTKKYKKTCVNARYPGPGNYVPYKSAQAFRISNSNAGFDDDCYSLWSWDESDSKCQNGCDKGCDYNINSGPGSPTQGQAFDCNYQYGNAFDVFDDNPCDSIPAGDYGGDGCDCCCSCCGGYGPEDFPYDNGNTCEAYDIDACASAFMFGGPVPTANDNFNFS